MTKSAWPAPATSFVGRLDELGIVDSLLTPGAIATIGGPPGCGKTRLAIELGKKVSRDGELCFVSLALARDEAAVASAFAESLGVGEKPGTMLFEAVERRLSGAKGLIVLDNCEQVTRPAGRAISRLHAAAPDLAFLCTSRVPLDVPGEIVLWLEPLPASQAQPDAVDLFRARARAHAMSAELGDEALLLELCQALDGLPLAIELAAAWVPTLTPADILARLTERFRLLVSSDPGAIGRQRTLEAAIAWSYDLLEPRAQLLFRRLSAFPGSFGLDAAEEVGSGGELPTGGVLDLLRTLVRHSMVQPGGPAGSTRFHMLESIRAYGEERLRETGELAAVYDRMADWMLGLAEWSVERLGGPEQASTLAHLNDDRATLRAALSWSLQSGNGTRALRLSGAAWRYWLSLSHIREGLQWLQESLAIANGAPITERAAALAGAGVLARQHGDFATAASLLEEHLELRRELGQPREIAQAINSLSGALHMQGDSSQAATLLEEGLLIWRQAGDRRGEANALSNLGVIASDRGNHSLATNYGSQALHIREELGQPEGIAISLENLATAALRAGDLPAASRLFEKAVERYQELDELDGIATCLEGFARIRSVEGKHATGVRLLSAAAAIRRAIDVAATPVDAAQSEETLERMRAALGSETFAACFADGEQMDTGKAIRLAADRPVATTPVHLTRREHELAHLLATGASNKELSAALGISVRTVERHLYNVYRKIGARGRADAVIWAVELASYQST